MPLGLGQESQERRRLLVVAARFSRRRNLDPAVGAALAFLHGREVQRLAGLVGQLHMDPELSKFSSASFPLHVTSATTSVMVRPWLSTIGFSSFSWRMLRSHPGLGCGLTPITPSGMRTRTFSVAEPSQPCGTLMKVLKKLSAGASLRSSVAWAYAGCAEIMTAAAVAARNVRDIQVSSQERRFPAFRLAHAGDT